MIKKALLATLLTLAVNTAFATSELTSENCDVDIVALTINNDSSVKELREYKKELEATKGRVDYIYYYTLTHNRIVIKSEQYKYTHAVNDLKNIYKDDSKKYVYLENQNEEIKQALDDALANINKKTEISKKLKLLEIDDQIKFVNELIAKRPLLERIGF